MPAAIDRATASSRCTTDHWSAAEWKGGKSSSGRDPYAARSVTLTEPLPGPAASAKLGLQTLLGFAYEEPPVDARPLLEPPPPCIQAPLHQRLKLRLLKMQATRLAATSVKELEFLGSMRCHLPTAAAAAAARNSAVACCCTATCTSD